MPDLKELGAKHGAPAVIAALVAGTISATNPPTKETIIEKPMQVTVAASKHAWPDLSDAEKAILAARLSWLAGGGKVLIFCDGADCRDLQTDLDDAFEDAKVNSDRAIPVNPLGYGIAVLHPPGKDKDRAERLAADISAASSGRISPKTEANPSVSEGLFVVIGKRPRESRK